MKSRTKYPVSEDELRKIFGAAGLGELQSHRHMTNGWFNTVVDVTTTQGEYVIKIAPPPSVRVLSHEQNMLAQELHFYDLLRENGIALPQVYHSDFTCTLLPCHYFIMEKLQHKLRDNKAEHVQQLKDKFRGIKGTGFGYEQLGLEANWHLGFRSMVQALVDDCAAFSKPCRKGEKLLKMIDKHRDILEQVQPVLVHSDLHAGNLFWHNDKATLIDPERCFWGDWVCEYVLTGLPKHATANEKIRWRLFCCYGALVNFTEKYSRYHPWNIIWWMDVFGQIFFWRPI
ncbi:MAG: phosphotransferase [Oscillospiraceae bacterium]|nr:phosphotransferase [Oscillospiraceae bacterium]